VGRSLGPQRDIVRTVAILEAAGLRDRVKIAFDGWNLRGWHHPDGTSRRAIAARDRNDENSTYTMADALFSASFLSSCLRAGDMVRMANIAPSVNARGPLFVHPGGVVRTCSRP
jgi:alpha-N-arabinofuranosidase